MRGGNDVTWQWDGKGEMLLVVVVGICSSVLTLKGFLLLFLRSKWDGKEGKCC